MWRATLLWCVLASVGIARAETIQIDQSDLRRHAYMSAPDLRIELVEAAASLDLRVPAPGQVTFGDGQSLQLPAGTRVHVQLRNARPPLRQYAVAVRTFSRARLAEARQEAATWTGKGYTVRLLEVGRQFTTADGGTLADTRRVWVALGAFADEADATQLERRLQKAGVGTWIVMETLRRASGDLELGVPGAGTLATGPTPVRFTSAESMEVADVQFGIGFWGRGHRETRRYSGALEVDATVQGQVTLLNEIGITDYICGVVPVEISVKAPIEAMKAQAVSARTETLAKLGIKHFGEPFDFCASQHCQEYGGVTRANARTNAAVRETRGIALLQDTHLVDAVYSANCGGHTENNDSVWSSNPDAALRGVLDAPRGAVPFASPLSSRALQRWLTTRPQTYCGDPRVGEPDKFRWRVRLSAADLSQRVNRHYRVGNIQDIQLRERGVSGRLRRIDIIGDRDRVTVRKELNIRRVLGGLKSALFILDIERDRSGAPTRFTFTGGGWGHGVGMCQNGATGMALDGHKYPSILAHYFSHSYLQRVYE